jgi:putative phage-type endonuclease
MIQQRTPEWYAQRLGKATASRISDVVARTKTGWSALRVNYAADIIAERMTGRPCANYVSAPMQWGIDHEDEARLVYADRCGQIVQAAGFLDHPEVAWSGASPDGYVDSDGLVEIKCPNIATHLDRLLSEPGQIDGAHVLQMQWQMACTGRSWCDYVSFDPRLPESMQLHVERVFRDTSQIIELETQVTRFLAEIAGRIDQLTERYGRQELAA